MLKKILLILPFTLSFPIFAEYTIGISGKKNYGEHIFETGNKYPNLSGIRGGSRITYDRHFPWASLNLGYYKKRFSITSTIGGTGWYQKTNSSRDEDFFMGSITTEKGTKFSLYPPFLYDTAHTFTGTQNFADGIAKSVVNQIYFDTYFRMYMNQHASSSPWDRTDGYFLSIGFRYTYFKYILYDVNQFVNRPSFYGPIGLGLTFSQSLMEIPFGLGYTFNVDKIKIEPSFFLLIGFNRYRDFHVQRALNFIGRGVGNGFIYRLQISYLLSEKDILYINTEGHRFFAYTLFKTTGGITRDDILSTFSGDFRSYITSKESFVEFGYTRRFGDFSTNESEPKQKEIEEGQ
ncbi:MAG: putative porin [Leptospiraceae bacterium]|nr:putative porin [Leptospiraceae bacterium]